MVLGSKGGGSNILGWWFQICCLVFYPDPLGKWSNLKVAYFSNGLVQWPACILLMLQQSREKIQRKQLSLQGFIHMMFDLFAADMAGFLNHQQYVACKLVLRGHQETSWLARFSRFGPFVPWTWRIIPLSKELVTPIYKPLRPFGREITQESGTIAITTATKHMQVMGWSSKKG